LRRRGSLALDRIVSELTVLLSCDDEFRRR
jgi:hypothetical protein